MTIILKIFPISTNLAQKVSLLKYVLYTHINANILVFEKVFIKHFCEYKIGNIYSNECICVRVYVTVLIVYVPLCVYMSSVGLRMHICIYLCTHVYICVDSTRNVGVILHIYHLWHCCENWTTHLSPSAMPAPLPVHVRNTKLEFPPPIVAPLWTSTPTSSFQHQPLNAARR